MVRCLVFVAVLSLIEVGAVAQELVGAKEALRLYGEKVLQAPVEEEDTSEFTRVLKEYQRELPDLDAQTAATRWLAVYDAGQNALGAESELTIDRMYGASEWWSRLLNALPGPESWSALQQSIVAREVPEDRKGQIADRGLRLLANYLNGDFKAMKTDLVSLQESLAASPAQPAGDDDVLNEIVRRVGDRNMFGPNTGLASTITELRLLITDADPVERFIAELESSNSGWGSSVSVPDLVGLAGRERARELLKRAFEADEVQLSFDSTKKATLELAREVALESIDSLSTPPWGLCLSPDTGALFERLVQRFAGEPDDFGYEYASAASLYFRGLILRGDDQAATALFLKHSDNSESKYDVDLFVAWSKLRATQDEQLRVFRFLLSLAESHPESNIWDNLVLAAAQVDRTQEVRQLVDRIVARDDLNVPFRRRLADVRSGVLLAAGEIDEAIAQFRETLNAIGDPATKEDINAAGLIAAKMIRVGRLRNRVEWADEAMVIADQLFQQPVERQPTGDLPAGEYMTISVFDIYRDELIRRDRLGRVEQLLIEQLAAGRGASNFYFGGNSSSGLQLAELYLQAERYDDIVTLLDEATWWENDDLSDSIGPSYYYGRSQQKSLAYLAARAFVESGRRDLARQIAERLVTVTPGNDAYWAVLLELSGTEFPGIANRVYQRDRFEERPLIWLARYQFGAGQIAEAEETIRRAIAIDPSDGEQGKGDRMRAYAVLADVLAAKGDDQAEIFRGAVRAIRMAETADEIILAGMYSEGIALYNASLNEFADAYCIQSRLAIQLASHGDYEAAAQHYERAFELMPDSFGRVESHCFGCEGAFNGELASTIAERVFSRLVLERPNDAKVHYLTGYLRASQGRPTESLANYRQATVLDPDYLNAWGKIIELRSEVNVPAALIDDAALNMYRLSPLRPESRSTIYVVRDLVRLWNTVAEVQQRIPNIEAGSLYPLTAAANERSNQQANSFSSHRSQSEDLVNPQSPNQAVESNATILLISQIMNSTMQ